MEEKKDVNVAEEPPQKEKKILVEKIMDPENRQIIIMTAVVSFFGSAVFLLFLFGAMASQVSSSNVNKDFLIRQANSKNNDLQNQINNLNSEINDKQANYDNLDLNYTKLKKDCENRKPTMQQEIEKQKCELENKKMLQQIEFKEKDLEDCYELQDDCDNGFKDDLEDCEDDLEDCEIDFDYCEDNLTTCEDDLEDC